MARNRVGVQADSDNGETVASAEKVAAPVGDQLEQKRLTKQKELLRKKKAERRAHAKQRKQAQVEIEVATVDDAVKAERAPVLGAEREQATAEIAIKGRSPEMESPPRGSTAGSHSIQNVTTPEPEAFTETVAPLELSPERAKNLDEQYEEEAQQEPEVPQRQPSITRDSEASPAQQPSNSSLISEAPTLTVVEIESCIYDNLCLKKIKKSRPQRMECDGDDAATTIQKALKRSLLQQTKRTLSKAKSLIRHSSKVLVEVESVPLSPQPNPIRPVIVPPLNLKPRSPPPSSSSEAEPSQSSASSSGESSPNHTHSRPSSVTSNSTSSSRSRSSSSSSSTPKRLQRRTKRTRTKPNKGPSVDMVLPPMALDRVCQYGELHDYMATRIQARVRGMRGRLHAQQRETELDHEIRIEALREVEEEASVRIQAHIKGFLERRRLGLQERHKSARHNHRKHPYTKANSVMPQCLADAVLGQDGDASDKPKVAEWPDEFNLEPLDKWDELNSKAASQDAPVTTALFLSRGKLRVFCGTWNLHAKKPTDDLRLWIPVNKYHIVAVGTEECVHSIAKSVVFTSKKQWEDQLKETLGSEYVLVAAHSLTAIHNAVFVHESVLPLVHNIQSDAVATGLGNQLGNKGGVGIAFCVGPTSLAFVNCHFDAHQHNVTKRNANFHRINHELKLVPHALATVSSLAGRPGLGKSTVSRFTLASTGSSSALNAAAIANSALPRMGSSSSSLHRRKHAVSESFDRVFWYGDLNYRINGTRRMIDLLLLHDHHAVLRFNDQLRMEMHKGNVFPHFQEGPLHFRPTYKFDKHSNVYDSGPKQRIPSWTDRILYLSNDKPSDIELLSYRSHMNFQTSDHRPVGAVFQVTFSRPATATEDAAPPADRGGNARGGGEEAQAFARVLAKGYKSSQSRSEVCAVQ